MRASKVVTQIYEIQDPWEAEAVISLGVDRIGSVLLSADEWKVPRIKEAIAVSRDAGREHSLIPLFDDMETLFRVLDYYEPHLLHFCDALRAQPQPPESQVRKQVTVRERYSKLQTMRSIPVCPSSACQETLILDLARQFEPVSDYLLIDTWVPGESNVAHIGITGRACDWNAARRLVEASSVPVILAGGLSPENVYQAIEAVRPFGVDSCTLTNARDETGEMVRFKKDLSRVKHFIEEVQKAERDFAA